MLKYIVVFLIAMSNIFQINGQNYHNADHNEANLTIMDNNIASSKIIFHDARIRCKNFQKGFNSAAYAVIENLHNQDIVIYNVKSTISHITEIHDIISDNNVKKMIKLSKIIVPASSKIIFKPASQHIMLISLLEDMQINKEYSILFQYKFVNDDTEYEISHNFQCKDF